VNLLFVLSIDRSWNRRLASAAASLRSRDAGMQTRATAGKAGDSLQPRLWTSGAVGSARSHPIRCAWQRSAGGFIDPAPGLGGAGCAPGLHANAKQGRNLVSRRVPALVEGLAWAERGRELTLHGSTKPVPAFNVLVLQAG